MILLLLFIPFYIRFKFTDLVDNKTHWVNCITRRKCRREAIDAAFIKYVIGEVVTRINLLTTEAKYVYLA